MKLTPTIDNLQFICKLNVDTMMNTAKKEESSFNLRVQCLPHGAKSCANSFEIQLHKKLQTMIQLGDKYYK